MKSFGLFGAGFVAGFAALFLLMLIFGDYEETPTPRVVPVSAALEATPTALLATATPSQMAPTMTPAPSPAPTLTPLPTSDPLVLVPTLGMVLGAFEAAGIEMQEIEQNPTIEGDSPLPRSFRHRATWKDAILGDSGGQVFICDSPDLCAAISSYFQVLAGLAGPYIYTSPNGLVVAQVNSGFMPDQAIRYRNALERF